MIGTRLRNSRWLRKVIRGIGVHRVVLVVHVLQLPLMAVLQSTVGRLPRDRELCVFGATLDRFADNAAYLFLQVSRERASGSATRPVWITGSREVRDRLRSAGHVAHLRWSPAGVHSCLRAGTYVYSGYLSDINRLLSPGARAVCLWHGIGLKRLKEYTPPSPGAGSWLARAGHEPRPDVFLSSTELVTREIFGPAFGVSPDQCWELGYPRNDHLVARRPPPPELVSDEASWRELAAAPFVVGLFLTWRDGAVDDVVDEAVMQRLAEICRSRGGRLAYKAHYNVLPSDELPDGCTLIPTDADLHAYLGLCDLLITDYSSISFDFMLTHRPVVYFMPDLDRYLQDRGLYFDPHTVPGEVVRDSDSLLQLVEKRLSSPLPWSDADEEFVRSVWGEYAGAACEDLATALRERPTPSP